VYDLVGALILLAFLYLLQRRKPRTGVLFATFSIWYGIQRVVVDFTRNREAIESVFLGLSGSQWAGIAFAVGGLIALVRISRSEPAPAGGAPPMPQPAPVPQGPPPSTLSAEAALEHPVEADVLDGPDVAPRPPAAAPPVTPPPAQDEEPPAPSSSD
jgi:hypothetical protein